MRVFATAFVVAAAATGALPASAANVFGFTGAYAPGMWATSPGDGSIDTFTASTLAMTGGNAGRESFTDATITVGSKATRIRFDYAYTTGDSATDFDPFGILNLAGQLEQVTVDGGPLAQSGHYSYLADPGTMFGFRLWSIDGFGGAANVVISNFAAATVPLPGTLALLGAAGLAAGAVRRRRA